MAAALPVAPAEAEDAGDMVSCALALAMGKAEVRGEKEGCEVCVGRGVAEADAGALPVRPGLEVKRVVTVGAGLAVEDEVSLPRGDGVCAGGEGEVCGEAVPEALLLPPPPPPPPLAVAAAVLLTLPTLLLLARLLGVPPRPLAAPASPLAVAGAEAAGEGVGL